VGMAEVVTSRGRTDLDEAARAWIVRHWTYQPALDKGRPVISHVVASILFRLDNAR
jgi:outer membrane biosynthesis protein TonB